MHPSLAQAFQTKYGIDIHDRTDSQLRGFLAELAAYLNERPEVEGTVQPRGSGPQSSAAPLSDFDIDFDDDARSPVVSVEQMLNLPPERSYPRLNAMTERTRGIFQQAVFLEDPLLKFGSVMEFSVQERPEQGVAQLFFLWADSVFRPAKPEVDPAIKNALFDALKNGQKSVAQLPACHCRHGRTAHGRSSRDPEA
jgi:hypothetical protein